MGDNDNMNENEENESLNINDSDELAGATNYYETSLMPDMNENEVSGNSNSNYQENVTVNKVYQENNMSSIGHTPYIPEYINVPKKKTRWKFVTSVIVIVILVGSITAYLNRVVFLNIINRIVMKPAQYYYIVEQKRLDTDIDKFIAHYDKSLAKNDQLANGMAQDIRLKLTLNPALTSMLGKSNMEPIEAFCTWFANENKAKCDIGCSYEGTPLLTINEYSNKNTREDCILFPDLSSAYLRDVTPYNWGDDYLKITTSDSESLKTLNQLLKKYSALIIKGITDVSYIKASSIPDTDMDKSFTTLQCTIQTDNICNAYKAALSEAKDDQELKEFCKTVGVCTEEEYAKVIVNAINTLNSYKQTHPANYSFIMNVYIDKNGNVIGREFKPFKKSLTSIGYFATKKGKEYKFGAWFTLAPIKLLDVSGNATLKDGTYNGSCTVKVNLSDAASAKTYNIAFENAGMVKDKGFIKGKYTITSVGINPISIVADCTDDQKQQLINAKIMYADMEAATLDITVNDIDYMDFNLPTDSEQFFDVNTEFDAYKNTTDFESYVKGLEKTLGIEGIYSYIENYFKKSPIKFKLLK